MRITATESVTITRSHVRHVLRVSAVRAVAPVTVPVHDTDAILHHVDTRIRNVETSRRNDMLVALPAALAPVIPFLIDGTGGLAATVVLACPVIVKILRRF